jgi:hypothetical protein
MQVSTTNKKMGGTGGILVIVYSIVENWGINSAGWKWINISTLHWDVPCRHYLITWLLSEMAPYCGGNAFLFKQKLHTQSFDLKSTWHMGLRTARQLWRLHRTGSYWIGGRSERDNQRCQLLYWAFTTPPTWSLLEGGDEDGQRHDHSRGLEPRRRPHIPRDPNPVAVLVLLDIFLVRHTTG